MLDPPLVNDRDRVPVLSAMAVITALAMDARDREHAQREGIAGASSKLNDRRQSERL